jgi:predicted nucleic acid-binding protein
VTSLNDTIAAGSTLFLDSGPIIYFVEQNPSYYSLLAPFFARVDQGEIAIVTSPITLAECLYYPYKNEDKKLAETFTRRLVTDQNVGFMPITADIADHSAQLRVKYNLGFADAFQVATAVASGCDIFLTNDKQLKRVTSLKVVVLSDFN